MLISADGMATNAIEHKTGKSKTCMWRWQERFASAGANGLLRGKTQLPSIAPLPPESAK